MGNFHISIKKPEEIIPRLGKPELHWKKGRSAFELSTAWMQAKGLPTSVKATLDQASEWRGAKLLEGIFERKTSLPGRGWPSQTDLLAILALKDGNAILGVEGKVDEPFGDLVDNWLAGTNDRNRETRTEDQNPNSGDNGKNRKDRLARLCATLNVDVKTAGRLFYQLFHRTCASIYEAERFGYKRAVVLIHSFAEAPEPSRAPACFDEFSAFADMVGMPVFDPGSISPPRICNGIEVRLAWVSDKPSI